MMYFVRISIFFVSLIALNSCGFKSIHSTELNSTFDPINSIMVMPVASLEGAEYYNHLKNILPSSKNFKYRLETSLSYSSNHGIIQVNSDILRDIVTVHVQYTMTEIQNEKVVMSGKFSRISSYSTNFSPYSNLTIEHDIRKNLATISAEEVRNRIILFFQSNKK